jgi:NMD protein affecting ribosome stability and mRNA decay
MDCHYCGAPASTKDHIVPISYNYTQRPKSHRSKGGVTVDCCRECNSLLGAKALFSIEERAHEIAECLERRYKKELKAPVWTDEDLAELGPSLQKQVKAKQILRMEILERIRNAVSVAQGLLERALPLWSLS